MTILHLQEKEAKKIQLLEYEIPLILNGMKSQSRRPYQTGEPETKNYQWLPYGNIGETFLVENTKLVITNIFLDRLHNMTTNDYYSEGINRLEPDPESIFKSNWNSLYNGNLSWENNPLVWVYFYKQLDLAQ